MVFIIIETYMLFFSATSRAMGFLMELRKAANHPLLIRDYYTDDMLSTMAQNYCKVL